MYYLHDFSALLMLRPALSVFCQLMYKLTTLARYLTFRLTQNKTIKLCLWRLRPSLLFRLYNIITVTLMCSWCGTYFWIVYVSNLPCLEKKRHWIYLKSEYFCWIHKWIVVVMVVDSEQKGQWLIAENREMVWNIV